MTTRPARLLLALSLLAPSVHAAIEVEGPGLSPGEIAPITARPQIPALPPAGAVNVEITEGAMALPTVPTVEPEGEAAASTIVPASRALEPQRAAAQEGLETLRSFGEASPASGSSSADAAPGRVFDGARGPTGYAEIDLTPVQFARQVAARVKLLAQRAATLPAHVWPFTSLTRKISHGEGLAGLTPASAVRAAQGIRAEHGAGTVVGRLSWELHDVWSVRGAVRSYAKLIDAAAEAKDKDPRSDIAVSLDVEALGAQLDGLSLPERTRIAAANALSLAYRARQRGLSVEFDVGASALLPLLLEVSHAVVKEVGITARLALAARYLASEGALHDWAALARETGLKLGVRLVKGSFIEGDHPGTLYVRRELFEQYKRLITLALSHGGALDVAIATHNEEIWRHARAESLRLNAGYTLQTIRGVNAQVQAGMRASGSVPREYVSYGVDTPVMALMEWWTNWRQKRALRRRVAGELD